MQRKNAFTFFIKSALSFFVWMCLHTVASRSRFSSAYFFAHVLISPLEPVLPVLWLLPMLSRFWLPDFAFGKGILKPLPVFLLAGMLAQNDILLETKKRYLIIDNSKDTKDCEKIILNKFLKAVNYV